MDVDVDVYECVCACMNILNGVNKHVVFSQCHSRLMN